MVIDDDVSGDGGYNTYPDRKYIDKGDDDDGIGVGLRARGSENDGENTEKYLIGHTYLLQACILRSVYMFEHMNIYIHTLTFTHTCTHHTYTRTYTR